MMKVKITKSNAFIFAQLVNEEGKTLVGKRYPKSQKTAIASGENFGKIIKSKDQDKIAYDRGKNRYHGSVKDFADGIRKSGVEV